MNKPPAICQILDRVNVLLAQPVTFVVVIWILVKL